MDPPVTHVSWSTGLPPGISSTVLTWCWNTKKTFLKNLYGLNIPPHAATVVRATEQGNLAKHQHDKKEFVALIYY